ncbi:MAG: transporter [Flavobacteriaceae bacterium]|jgi:hypothetical protein|nr:transporter [Flavobacteriaceae bacterium]
MKSLNIFIIILIAIQIQAGNGLDSLQIKSIEIPCLKLELLGLDCDACGCSAGNGSSGFETLLQSQFVGVKYFAQHYKAKENAFVNQANYDQYFNTIMLWSRISLTEKLEVYGSIPYHFHNRETNFGNQNIKGIGDATVMGIYTLLNKQTEKMNHHQLNLGGGVKIPLGKFNESSASGTNPSFQLGTGSWDVLMALNYRYEFGKSAVMLGLDYTLKGENEKKYEFGDQFNYSVAYHHYFIRKENFILTGRTGFQGEIYQPNKQFGEILNRTSGDALFGKAGFELGYKNWSLGSEWMLPVVSNLGSNDIEARSRFSFFLNFGL